MTDIAALGFAVDSSGLESGKASLNELANAAAKTERAVESLGRARGATDMALKAARAAEQQARAALKAMQAVENANRADIAAQAALVNKLAAQTASERADLSRATAALAAARADDVAAQSALKAAQANAQLSTAMNDNAVAARGNASQATNLAYQFQDVAVTAAMGMNPMMIAMQQGTQISMVYREMAEAAGKGASSISILGSALAAFAGPSTLVIIAITALVAGLLQLVPWTDLAKWGLHGIADILPVITPYAAAAAAGLALLYAPAILSGLASTTGLLVSLTKAVIGLAAAIGTIVGLPALVIAAFVAMGAAAVIWRDDLAKLLGVDIVKMAKDGANYVIGSFVAAFNDVKLVWQSFPTVMGAAAIGAANTMIFAINKMVAAAVSGIDWLIEKANSASAMVNGPQIGKIGKALEVKKMPNPYAGQVGKLAQRRASGQQADLNYDYLGTGWTKAGKAAEWLSGKVHDLANNIGKADEKAKKAKGGKTEAEHYADIVANADRRIASLQAETQALGLTEEAAAKLRYEQELLNQASQKDITLSAAQRAELAAKAEEMSRWEIAAKKVKEAYDFVRDGVKGFISDFRQGLQNGEGALQSFVNAASNLLDKLISKIEDQLVDALMKAFDFGGLGGGSSGGGLLGGLMSLIIPNAKGGVYATAGLSSYSNSVVSQPTLFAFASGAGLMGEAGPEAIMPLSRGSDGRLGVQVHQGNAGGGGGAANVTVAPVYNIQTSGGKTDNEDLKKVLDQSNADLKKMVQSVLVDDIRKMGPISSANKQRFGLNETRGIG